MNFISAEYFILLTLAVIACYTLPHRQAVWAILIASLVFYGWAYPPYLLILFTVGGIAYSGGLLIERYRSSGFLWVLIILALALLFYYKYYPFCIHLMNDVLGSLVSGYEPAAVPHIALPIGISFFTFQAISYIADVYRGDIKPERSPVTFMLFKAFFPQLVAGPIERAPHLIPQIKRFGTPEQPALELGPAGFMILKGVLVKFVFADNLAEFVDASYTKSLPAARRSMPCSACTSSRFRSTAISTATR